MTKFLLAAKNLKAERGMVMGNENIRRGFELEILDRDGSNRRNTAGMIVIESLGVSSPTIPKPAQSSLNRLRNPPTKQFKPDAFFMEQKSLLP